MAKAFYGIDMRGKFLLERRTSDPSAEQGRMYLRSDTDRAYLCKDGSNNRELVVADGGTYDIVDNGDSVTFANLNANGDVGTGAAQVAQGDHTHAAYVDIPTGTQLFFFTDTAVAGYTLINDAWDDMLIYTSKGSANGGQTGGTSYPGSTWTQPWHAHTVSRDGWGNTGGGPPGPGTAITAGRMLVGSGGVEVYETLESIRGAGNYQTASLASSSNTWRPSGIVTTRQQRN